MSLKDLHVGGWYRCLDGDFLANILGVVTGEDYPFVVAYYKEGKFSGISRVDNHGRMSTIVFSEGDLKEYLPNCNSPNWNPQKWRKATVQDAVDDKQCRVTLDERTFESNISGFKRDARYLYFYIMHQGQCKYWYDSDCVEVLDD